MKKGLPKYFSNRENCGRICRWRTTTVLNRKETILEYHRFQQLLPVKLRICYRNFCPTRAVQMVWERCPHISWLELRKNGINWSIMIKHIKFCRDSYCLEWKMGKYRFRRAKAHDMRKEPKIISLKAQNCEVINARRANFLFWYGDNSFSIGESLNA